MRIVFMGTPQFAVPSLERLVEAGHDVCAVYTQPDRPKGRGGEVVASPVKQAALRSGIAVRQPERVRRPEVIAELSESHADAMVVVGYGQIIPQAIIDLPRLGIVNVHASLLPKYRGAAPIQWAVANGETRTGVTTMLIDAGLDTGAMLQRCETEIGTRETAEQLAERLAEMGADLLVETMRGLEQGTVVPEKQDDAEATHAPILKKEHGLIDWQRTAPQIDARVRGFRPWPGCYTSYRGQTLLIWEALPVSLESEPARAAAASGMMPGQRVPAGRNKLWVACGESTLLELREVQLEGRKRMPVEAFLNGQRPDANERFGEKL